MSVLKSATNHSSIFEISIKKSFIEKKKNNVLHSIGVINVQKMNSIFGTRSKIQNAVKI